MSVHLSPKQTEGRVLWIDDDELVLSSAQRFLRDKKINCEVCPSPTKALDILNAEKFSVVIVDQRMPEMTGVELLEIIRSKHPQTTRIMITGFLDGNTLEESINRAGVFRYVTKPWNEDELAADIHRAFEHHNSLVEQQALTLQVREQNRSLTTLNENLEKIVFDRTKIISESRREVENKNLKIKNLISFIQELNKSESLEDLLSYFKKEFQSKFSVVVPHLLFESVSRQSVLMYFQKNQIVEKQVPHPNFIKLDIHASKRDEQEFFAKVIGRPVTQLLCVPLLRYQSGGIVPLLFIEHNFEKTEYDVFLDYLTERLQVIGLAVDRSLMVLELKNESHRWEKTFDSIEDPIAIIDVDFNILRMNQTFDQFSKVLSEDETHLIKESARTKLPQKKQIKKLKSTYETYTYPILFSGISHPTNFVNYYVDVTRQRELYSKMIQNEKMVALGLMAGNIAHELNNPLTGISSIAQVLMQENKNKTRLVEDLEEVNKAAIRCQKVIEDLLEFSQTTKGQKDHDVAFAVNDIIQRTLPLLKTALRYHSIEMELTDNNLMVFMKPRQLQQVIFNLINNACQSLREPGTISILTEVENKLAKISIADTGSGIVEQDLLRIFDPFFTTKAEGEGTGLGLSVCKSIIEKAGGTISVISKVGKGSTFSVLLPIHGAKVK